MFTRLSRCSRTIFVMKFSYRLCAAHFAAGGGAFRQKPADFDSPKVETGRPRA
ncbi:hypothetical protein [Leisingera sp. McT4-56]|uniref:hypothetical protein n=1 Tax=Leisingera sp. McT4-56 TaxID=2881255 RepID=UPI001CF8B95E|nr:hypothetical protein [Leisingera sp. McT4-56]